MLARHAVNAPKSRTLKPQEDIDLTRLLQEIGEDARSRSAEYLQDTMVREGGE